MSITMIGAGDLGDVAGMLRRLADRREAELNARPADAETADRACVTILRASADYHERQATRRKHLNAT